MGKTTRIGHDDEVKSLITQVELGVGVPLKKQEKVALPVGTVTLLLADAEGSTRSHSARSNAGITCDVKRDTISSP